MSVLSQASEFSGADKSTDLSTANSINDIGEQQPPPEDFYSSLFAILSQSGTAPTSDRDQPTSRLTSSQWAKRVQQAKREKTECEIRFGLLIGDRTYWQTGEGSNHPGASNMASMCQKQIDQLVTRLDDLSKELRRARNQTNLKFKDIVEKYITERSRSELASQSQNRCHESTHTPSHTQLIAT
ncbi:uncharacterized protein L203_101242 [Cryptococcus depauperatus CBS 7841]|uniref:Uncharacterized protein n=1 Tax=Cryptococcus depauperatus CBS 7841 TaxID=1295531 RepID=A0A1E3IEV4_9TREE|nr:hypothetical protein L203_04401 [Cryptococcus depauperatus CBS 7841]